ncbi:MAG: DNA polymerase IV, partial [Polyangiales bacterium]
MRAILHIDMDAFFAAVEQRDDPSLRGKPVLVGGDSPRGVVAAASYEARVYGVHSAMPMLRAKSLCPNAIVVFPRRDAYVEASRQVFSVFERYTPEIEGLSLDEAFLDVTASRSLFGDAEAIANAIKKDIREKTELVASAGVATSKFVAKIASDFQKPDGLTVVHPGNEQTFLAPLPLQRMWRLGPKASERLLALGMRTIGDLARTPERTLVQLLGSWGSDVSR